MSRTRSLLSIFLGEDPGAGAGLAVAAATLVSEAFGLGRLPWGEAPHEGVQFFVAHPGQRRV